MILVVLGRKGCGKTTEIKKRLKGLPRLLVFDTLAEYGDCGETFYSALDLIEFVKQRNHRFFRAVLAPMQSQDISIDLAYLLRCAWIASDCTIVIDEIDQVSSPTSIPFQLARMIRYGRHRGLHLIAASRRAAEVPRTLTSQADELISFNQTEPNDVKYIERYCGSAFAEETMRLPRFRFATFRPFESHAALDTEADSDSN